MRKMLFKKSLIIAILCTLLFASQGMAVVNYEIWDASFDALPDYSTLGAPDQTGTINNFIHGPLRGGQDYFTIRYTGYILIDVAGEYTFYTSSDDGSKLYIGEPGGELQQVVDNDGLHGTQERSGTINLEAGAYSIMVTFFEKTGGDVLEVRWEGPGITKDYIPDDKLINTGPFIALQPDPGNNAKLVPVDTSLSWEAPLLIPDAAYDIYFGTDPNTSLGTKYSVGAGVTTFDPPGDLAYGTTYYWRVDAIDPNDGGTPFAHKGLDWSFTTAPLYPAITQQPQETFVDPGGTAVLSISIYLDPAAPTDVTYQWYYEDPNAGGIALSNGDPDISGADTDTLTIANAELADELPYYCVVSNSNGSDESEKALLHIKRMKIYWPFDGNAADASGNGNDGTLNGEPAFVTGMFGSALQCDGVDDYVENTAPVGLPLSAGDPWSMSIWVYAEQIPGHLSLICGFGDDDTGTGRYLARFNDGIHFWGGHNIDVVTNIQYDLNQWQMIMLTYDGSVLSVYKDGELIGSDTIDFIDAPADVKVAQVGPWGNAPRFTGVLDDFRIFNYAWSAYDVAKYYSDTTGKEVCLGKPDMDLNGDCIVNLEDFGIFAANWMVCNWIPVTECP